VGEGLVEPVGLAISSSRLVWGDRDQETVVSVSKESGTGRRVELSKVNRLSALTSVKGVDPSTFGSHPCVTERGLCSHMCSVDPVKPTVAVCRCPLGLSLAGDGHTCSLPPTCQPQEFTCLSRGPQESGPQCIPSQWRCDGQSECADRSDELDCPECGPSHFRCQSGQCVPSSSLCDGTADCEDRTDEQLCCSHQEFQCAVTGECVPRTALCDGRHDCGDSSDELLPKCREGAAEGGPGSTPGDSTLCCPPDSPVRLLGSEAATHTTSTYLIAVFAAIVSLFLLGLVIMYCRRQRASAAGLQGVVASSGDPLGAPPQGERTAQPSVATQERGRAVGADQNSGASQVSPVVGSSNGLLYDRSHVTGASSTCGTSSSGNQGAGKGPPPSPATSAGTKLSRLKGHGVDYRYYSLGVRGGPPCTPASTDVNDESDSLAYCRTGEADSLTYSALPNRPHFPSRAGSLVQSRTGYESETYGVSGEFSRNMGEGGRYAPPATPLYLSDYGDQELSCPPSPTTERSFFLNPYLPGPPPSPVRSPDQGPRRNK